MAGHPHKIVIIAGEASGDLHGAYLALGIKNALPDAEISGIGGKQMRSAGVKLIADSSSWGAIGITEALKLVPNLLVAKYAAKTYLEKNPPDLLILIDFGAFNVRLRKALNLPALKTLYFFPPGSWKHNADYSSLKEIVDRIVTPFSWSADNLREQGFNAYFFGHPLLDTAKPTLTKNDFCERFGFNTDKPIIGLLPGSRLHEIIRHIPALVTAADTLHSKMPDLQFAIPVAPSVSSEILTDELRSVPWIDIESCIPVVPDQTVRSASHQLKLLRRLADMRYYNSGESRVKIKLLPGMASDLLAYSRAAIVTSGTATLESTIHGCPMVIIYKGSRLAEIEYKIRQLKIKFIGMPNIIMDREICPELIQHDMTPEKIVEKVLPLINDTAERKAMVESLGHIRKSLGEPGAINKTVDVVLEMLGAIDRKSL
ncbi:MAG: lipid-A-disaccharide synthase [Armatimonadota bacterium]